MTSREKLMSDPKYTAHCLDKIRSLEEAERQLHAEVHRLQTCIMRRNAVIAAIIFILGVFAALLYIQATDIKDYKLQLQDATYEVGWEMDGATPDINDHPEEYPLITGVWK